jgi:opacity protein-like surface antigen
MSRKTFRFLLVCAALSGAPLAVAQPLGVGLKLGATLTNAVSAIGSESIPNSNTLIVGPYIELRLPLGFSIEGDALYYPGIYSNAAGGGSIWQFPILAKFGPQLGPIRPYVEGGPAYSHLSDVKTLPDLVHSSNYGLTLGAGIELKIRAFRIAPEIRYNGVALTSIQSPLGLFKANHNQVVFEVGIGF